MKSKAERLLERFPVTDLALAVTYRGPKRERFLQRFVDEFTPKSYRAVRDAARLIYNAQPPLIELPPPARDALMTGRWDGLGLLLADFDAVRATAARLPYLREFTN